MTIHSCRFTISICEKQMVSCESRSYLIVVKGKLTSLSNETYIHDDSLVQIRKVARISSQYGHNIPVQTQCGRKDHLFFPCDWPHRSILQSPARISRLTQADPLVWQGEQHDCASDVVKWYIKSKPVGIICRQKNISAKSAISPNR